MAENPQNRRLGSGRTVGDINTPIRVGGDGEIDGSGEPLSDTVGSLPNFLVYGRTALGVNVPLRTDADGKLNIDWNL